MASTDNRSSPFRLFRSSKKVDSAKGTETKDSRRSKSPSSKSKTMPSRKVHKEVLSDHSYNTMPLDMDDDPESLIESLQALGDEQPKVARSIPKNSKPAIHEDRSLKDCLYTQDVYDGMLSDSLKMCSLLQSHLDECVLHVRAKSPDGNQTTSSLENHSDADSGRGASSPASPPPSRANLKSCVKHDV